MPINNQLLEKLKKIVTGYTRFKASDVRLDSEKSFDDVVCRVKLTQSVEFKAKHIKGTGSLVDGVRSMDSLESLKAFHNDAISSLNSELPQALQKWVDASANACCKKLSRNDCMLRNYPHAGTCYECDHGCDGTGKLSCATCSRSGKTDCHSCSANGRLTCRQCMGSSSLTCHFCHGAGYREVPAANDSNRFERIQCSSCQNGQMRCNGCSQGYVQCTSCNGHGWSSCRDCSGSGHKECGHCEGKGSLYEIYQVEPVISTDIEYSDESQNEDVKKALSLLFTKDNWIDEIAKFSAVQYEVEGNTVRSINTLHLKITYGSFTVNDQKVELIGYGPDAKIFDFNSIISRVLSKDVEKLEEEIKRSRFYKSSDFLEESMRNFLRSEIHMRLSEVHVSKSSELIDPICRNAPHCMADSYLETTGKFASRAINALRLPIVLRWTLLGLLASTAIAEISLGILPEKISFTQGLAASTAAAVGFWALGENRAAKGIFEALKTDSEKDNERIQYLLSSREYKWLWTLALVMFGVISFVGASKIN